MKGMCYIVLIVAFLMFYQRDPIFTIVIIGLAVGVYLFFKSRKGSSREGGRGFLSAITRRGIDQQERNVDDMITLMMLQQLFSNSTFTNSSQNAQNRNKDQNVNEDEIQRIKAEVLGLLDKE
jgi:hypothetical protein